MDKGQLTRQRIVAEAAPLFNQRGFAGCSMQDVMEATGLEKGGIYRHFASKEALAVAAYRYALGRVHEARMGKIAQVPGAIDKLAYVVERFVNTPSPVAGGCPLMNAAIDSDDGNPAIRAQAKASLRAWKSALGKIVAQGVRDGEIVVGTEPGRIANIIIATLEGALMISRLEGKRDALLDAQATLERMLAALRPSDQAAARSR